jgi:hypothetical protein
MTTKEKEILRGIMEDLKAGYSFGKDYTYDYYHGEPLRYPYYGEALYITPCGSIGWTNYGSSANKCNLKELAWIISVIFKTTPSGFLLEYIRNDQSKVEY